MAWRFWFLTFLWDFPGSINTTFCFLVQIFWVPVYFMVFMTMVISITKYIVCGAQITNIILFKAQFYK